MENTVYILAMSVSAVVGFVAGMYVTTQIGDWIDKRIRKK
jgi:uncharacterized protein YneF (UPF0154 family)